MRSIGIWVAKIMQEQLPRAGSREQRKRATDAYALYCFPTSLWASLLLLYLLDGGQV